VAIKNDDNIFSQGTSEKSATITQILPKVQWLAEKDTDSYALTYSGDYGFYAGSGDDDYTDHTLSFDAAVSPNDRVSFDVGASYGKLHDNRGEGSSEGTNALSRKAPDEYDIRSVDFTTDLGVTQPR
jgi:polysaccharide biosynthesis protein VpsM